MRWSSKSPNKGNCTCQAGDIGSAFCMCHTHHLRGNLQHPTAESA